MFKPCLLALAVTVALTGCDTAPKNESTPIEVRTPKIDVRYQVEQVVTAYTKRFIQQQPALATSLKLAEAEYGAYQSRLPDYSATGMKELQNSMTQSITELSAIESSQLSIDQFRHVAINIEIAKYYQGDLNFPAGYIDTWGGHLPYIVSQISGPLIDIPKILQDQQEVTSVESANHYILRLQNFANLVSQVNGKVLSDAQQGIVLPKVLMPKTLSYLTSFVETPAEEHGLVTTFKAKLSAIAEINDSQINDLVNKAKTILTDAIYPEYVKVKNTMVQLQEKAPEDVGIWAQPKGDTFYQHEITYLADSTLTPEQIHQVGLQEVARISQEMNDILTAQNMTEGSVGERMVKLGEMPEFIYPDTDQGRADLLASLTKEIDNVMAKAPSLFATIPTQKVVVKRIPVMSQDGAPGGFYNGPALDGSRPGEYSINLKDMKAQPSFSLKTLTYHEAVPGHHFQISLNMAQTDIGLMRQNGSFNAYVEGWALYSELVAYEMGMYQDDPWGNLGRLQAEVYRAARLVVDTGLHYKKWTRQQAIDYFHQATGTAMSDVEAAIDRYIAWPGQALGYKLGMLKIVELREWAKAQLNEKFDIKAFHDLVLLPGARPLTILEADVKRWVEQSSEK